MKKQIIAIATLLYFIISTNTAVAVDNKNIKKILVIKAVDHPALNITTTGIIEGLQSAGFERGVNFELRAESAQANYAIAAQIASKFVNQKPDVVVGVATISAQALSKYAATKQLKLVFSSVTDPLAAHIVNSLSHPNNNTSGVSNFVALEPQLKLIKTLQPNIKRLGIVYNPAEINSISIVKKLEEICQTMNIVLIKQTAAKTADVAQAAAKIVSNVDAVFINNDNTALSSFQSIIKIANKANIPVYCSDTDVVEDGALAALGPSQREVGRQTGIMIAKILNGADINSMPIEFPKTTNLIINMKVANKLGIKIPAEILAKANTLIKDSN